ncbi:MAG: radical SAM protein [Actinomycetota bacterium]|nr:radical SAM protein [Actinomycetota bacterium]
MTTTPGSAEAFDLRLRNFGTGIEFYAPGLKRWETSEWKPENPRKFLPISVTGSACALSCDHCQTKVLDGMISVRADLDLFALATRLQRSGTDGLLVSGGSGKGGGVPLLRHLDDIRRIREELGMKVVVHSGVIDPKTAAGLARVGVDGVMLDIIGANETIRDVYHLDLTIEAFDESLALLAEQELRIIPHIVLGMHYGKFLGEYTALDMIARYPVSTLIVVVLVPLVGTPMEHVPPPPIDECADFFETARLALPTTKINLGCGRPMGDDKIALDHAAVDFGFNGIAYPAEGIIEYARQKGLTPDMYEYCCSLTWVGSEGESYRSVSLADPVLV